MTLAVGANVEAGSPPDAPRLTTSVREVRDLHYGDALFYFYEGDYFEALTRLDAALALGRVTQHQNEAQLLRGGLYLSMGQHIEAGRVFKELLNDAAPAPARDRAWFYMAKVWSQRGYLQEAEQALQSISSSLPEDLESERQLLSADLSMRRGQYDVAMTALSSLPRTDRNAPYARFNLGVALAREERLSEAIGVLDEVGQMAANNEEMASLRDKANLALGLALLKEQRPLDAAVRLERIRLRGPQSNKALLGAGWAAAAQQNYLGALAPWRELHGRNALDPAVQEAYLARPYAYAQLAATRQAAEQYADAIQVFQAERARIDESILAIGAGELLDAVLERDPGDKIGWYWRLQALPDAPATRYLFHLMATHEFQEGLKNYRDLKFMQRNLARWMQSVQAFQAAIETRRIAHSQRTRHLRKTLDDVDIAVLDERVRKLSARLTGIERQSDIVGMATADEANQWSKLQAVAEAMNTLDASELEAEEARDKVRLIRGVLQWNLSAAYKERLWRARKGVTELQASVEEAYRRKGSIEHARFDSPAQTDAFAARVDALPPRLDGLVKRLDAQATALNRYLANVAIKELMQQRQRLEHYQTQAQFALASLYDQAASERRDAGVSSDSSVERTQ